jgi:hypothetical protein
MLFYICSYIYRYNDDDEEDIVDDDDDEEAAEELEGDEFDQSMYINIYTYMY